MWEHWNTQQFLEGNKDPPGRSSIFKPTSINCFDSSLFIGGFFPVLFSSSLRIATATYKFPLTRTLVLAGSVILSSFLASDTAVVEFIVCAPVWKCKRLFQRNKTVNICLDYKDIKTVCIAWIMVSGVHPSAAYTRPDIVALVKHTTANDGFILLHRLACIDCSLWHAGVASHGVLCIASHGINDL